VQLVYNQTSTKSQVSTSNNFLFVLSCKKHENRKLHKLILRKNR